MEATAEATQETIETLSPIVTTSLFVAGVLIVAIVLNRVIAFMLRRAYRRRLERVVALRGVAERARAKRQQTLSTLLESLVRYAVYGSALVIIINIVRPGASSALFSATLLGVLLGFGLQRLLGDVIAGALLLFEGHFAVGDEITVHSSLNVTGTVEAFSLRTTTLRTASDDRVVLLNGAINSFTRWSYGQSEYRLEALVKSSDAVTTLRALVEREASASGAVWVVGPQIVSIDHTDHAARRVRIGVTVMPEHHDAIEYLKEMIAAQLGDELLGSVLALLLYTPTFEANREALLLRS